jgi:hypothetical protein
MKSLIAWRLIVRVERWSGSEENDGLGLPASLLPHTSFDDSKTGPLCFSSAQHIIIISNFIFNQQLCLRLSM